MTNRSFFRAPGRRRSWLLAAALAAALPAHADTITGGSSLQGAIADTNTFEHGTSISLQQVLNMALGSPTAGDNTKSGTKSDNKSETEFDEKSDDKSDGDTRKLQASGTDDSGLLHVASPSNGTAGNGNGIAGVAPTNVPEPSGLLVAATALLVAGVASRRRRG